MKRILSLLLAAGMVFGLCVPVWAETSESVAYGAANEAAGAEAALQSAEGEAVSGNWKYSDNGDGTVTLTGTVSSPTGDVVIPEMLDGKTVTAIAEYAIWFSGGDIGTLTIPASIRSIAADAFMVCRCTAIYVNEGNPAFCAVDGVLFNADKTELILYPARSSRTSYTVPDGVTGIWRRAFEGARLDTVLLPDTLIEIGDNAFTNSLLKKVTIPASVEKLSNGFLDSAFTSCSYLKTAGPVGSGCDIEYGWAEEIPEWAFLNCDSLVEITLPDTLKKIGYGAFYGTHITELTIPKNVEKLAQGAISDCYRIEAVYVDPENPYMCSVNGVLFSKDRTELMFYPHSKPDEEYVMPYGLKTIPSNGLRYVYNLKRLGLPKALTTVERWGASSCMALTDIYYAGSEEDWGKINIIDPETNDALVNVTFHFNEWLGNSIPGDLSGDGELSAADALLLSKYLSGDTSVVIDEAAADVNGDGEVNGLDFIYLRKLLAGWQP